MDAAVLGGIEALDVLITQQGRGFAEQLQAARANKYRRKGAARDAMVDWLYSRDALSPPGLPWEKQLEDPTKNYWFAQPFSRDDLDAASAWLHRVGMVDGVMIEEAQGPVVVWLTVDLVPRSFVAHVSGGRGCRFVVLRRRKLAPLTRWFEAQGLPVQHVRGTIGWLFIQD